MTPRYPGLYAHVYILAECPVNMKCEVFNRWLFLDFPIFKTFYMLLNPFRNKPWILRVCRTLCPLETLWEKEKLLVMSNFSFSHSVFYTVLENFLQFHQIWNCCLQSLSLWKSLKFVVWERVNSLPHNPDLWWHKRRRLWLPFPTVFFTLSKREILI